MITEADFMAALAAAARTVIAGPSVTDSRELRATSKGGSVPDPIAQELARPCTCGSAPRVSIRDQRTNAYWIGCLDCVGPVLATDADVSAWVVG